MEDEHGVKRKHELEDELPVKRPRVEYPPPLPGPRPDHLVHLFVIQGETDVHLMQWKADDASYWLEIEGLIITVFAMTGSTGPLLCEVIDWLRTDSVDVPDHFPKSAKFIPPGEAARGRFTWFPSPPVDGILDCGESQRTWFLINPDLS